MQTQIFLHKRSLKNIETWQNRANTYICTPKTEREVAQAGSAPGLGPGGRRFESCLPDIQISLGNSQGFFVRERYKQTYKSERAKMPKKAKPSRLICIRPPYKRMTEGNPVFPTYRAPNLGALF